VEGDALAFGAVNTVVNATGVGYNTDGLGFMQALKIAGIDVQGKSVLILGGGGAGRSAAAALKEAGADVSVYRRNRSELEELTEQLGVTAASDPERGGYDILVNATGVGMHDTVGVSPVGAKAFDGVGVAVDMIYRPAVSEFLRLANGLGLKTLNGASMLFLQAYYADCYFLQRQPSDLQAEELYAKYCMQEKTV
jgi:shikimate dehydrogenase